MINTLSALHPLFRWFITFFAILFLITTTSGETLLLGLRVSRMVVAWGDMLAGGINII